MQLYSSGIAKMSDIVNLFENLTLNDNIDNLIDDGKEINDLINSFDNSTIEKQHKCINNYKYCCIIIWRLL